MPLLAVIRIQLHRDQKHTCFKKQFVRDTFDGWRHTELGTKGDWLVLGAGRRIKSNHLARIELVLGLYDLKLA